MANHLLRLGVLTKLFFFSFWAARLLVFVGIPGAVIGITAKTIGMGRWEPFFVIGGAVLAVGTVGLYLTLVLMMFPAQLMSVVSSRQYGLLPNIRKYLAALMICTLVILQIVAICILAFGIKSDHLLQFSLIAAIMLIVSLLVMISAVQLKTMQFLYLFALPLLGWYLVPLLKLLSELALSGILIFTWVAFLSWWFGWHPKKYYKNLIGISAELNKQNLSFCGGIYSLGAVPQNLGAGILFGQFGNNFYPVRLFLTALIFTGSVFLLMFLLAPHGMGDGLMVGIRVGLAIQIIQIGYHYSLAVFKNINKFWLYFPLERTQLFHSIERLVSIFYLKNLVAITSIILAVSLLLPDKYLSLSNIVLYVLDSLLVTPISLYMVFISYAKWHGNIKIFHWINGVVMILLMGACFMGVEFASHNEITHYLGYLIIIVLLFVSVILIMRRYARRLWLQVDLVRVAV